MKVLLACDKITDDVKEEYKLMFQKYRPIEMDHSLPPHEKVEHMYKWWESNLRAVSALKIT